jgi:hypothetical protein
MNIRLGLLIVALILGSLLIWRIFLAVGSPDAQPGLFFWLVIMLLWGPVGLAYHRALSQGKIRVTGLPL